MNIKHDKEKVLKKGLQLFSLKGYNALGVDEICKVTGMTKGAFYNAYKSKEQFLLDAIQLYGEMNVQRISQHLNNPKIKSPFERLQVFYLQMLEAQNKADYVGCFVNNVMAELGLSNPIVSNIANIEFYKFIDAIEPTIKEALIQNEIKKELPSRDLAEMIHATFYGLLNRLKSTQEIPQSIVIMKLLFNNIKN